MENIDREASTVPGMSSAVKRFRWSRAVTALVPLLGLAAPFIGARTLAWPAG